MLKIRLSRGGSKQNPHYKIVVTESTTARDGKAIEIIGHYHPLEEKNRFFIDEARFSHWISHGAKPSETVAGISVKSGIEAAKKFVKAWKPSEKDGKSKESLKSKK